MARAPFALWRPLPTADAEPRITATQVLYHTMVGTLPGTDAYFRSGRSGGVESHFGVGGPWEGVQYDGVVWQWVDTGRGADANREANARAISIETSDGGQPDRPWTTKQLDALVALGRWAREVHGIQPRIIPSPYAGGYGWHAMWLNTPYQYADGTTPFTPSRGKVCPGATRIAQLKSEVLPAIFAGKNLEDDMPLDQADKDWFVARLEESERRVARYVDHGDAAVAGSGHHHQRVREDLAQLGAQVRDLKAVVDGIALGRLEGDLEVTGLLHVAAPVPPPPAETVTELP